MKPYHFLCLLGLIAILVGCKTPPLIDSTESLFRAMKMRNDNKWFQSFRFKQHTISFNDEGVKTDSTVWYESVSYPYYFRIDRDIAQGIYSIYRNDSTYSFQQDGSPKSSDKAATHLLFKGGLYFVSLEEALDKLKKYGYDTSIFRRDLFMGQKVFVVGNEDNQFWINAKNFYCMRRIYTTPSGKIVDAVYEDFKRLRNGWVEQKVTFYVDGVKRLEEFYFDIKVNESLDDRIYDIHQNYKWYQDY